MYKRQQLVPRILSPDQETKEIIQNLHNRRNMRLGLPHSVQAAMVRFFLPHMYADKLGLPGHWMVDMGVGFLYRSLGGLVSTIGQYRPDALEKWEIERVSQRLETILEELRQSEHVDPGDLSPLQRRIKMARELSRALLSV